MKLPKIKDSSNLSLNDEIFLTQSDDVCFALIQLKQLRKKIKTKNEKNTKLWEKKNHNIYTSYDNRSKFLIKSKKEKKNQIKSFDWRNQNIFNQSEISSIEAGEEIKKQVKIKYAIKYKYKDRCQTLTDFVSTKNDTFLSNTMIQILKDRKNHMIKNEQNYSKSLRKEILLLDKDINKFDDFVVNIEKKKKIDEALLAKKILDNKNLVDLYKKSLQEYNSTLYEIFKIMKSINEFKIYAKFIHKLLGGDNDILHTELIENITFRDFKNLDVHSITQKIFKNTKNLSDAKETKDFTKNIHNFNLTFKDMEDKLTKLFFTKHDYQTEINDTIKEREKIKIIKQKKYDELNSLYEKLLNELKESTDEYKKISIIPEEEDIIKFNYKLLIEIYSFLFPKNIEVKNIKELKVENAYDLKGDVVLPITSELNKLEEKVNYLLNSMEECSNENSELFEGFLIKRKNENRALRLLYEKNIIKMKEEMKIKKYDNKMRKIIIKDRHKYNLKIPHKDTKFKREKYIKTTTNFNDYNYLYF